MNKSFPLELPFQKTLLPSGLLLEILICRENIPLFMGIVPVDISSVEKLCRLAKVTNR